MPVTNTTSQIETPPAPLGDGTPQDPPAPVVRPNEDIVDEPRLELRPREDNRRDDIIARFRSRRGNTEVAEDVAEINAFANQGLPPELMPRPVPIEPEPQPAPVAPSRHKIKVLGEEKEMTFDEIMALAQKNAAADDYLSQSRDILKDTKVKAGELDQKLREVDFVLQQNRSRAAAPVAETHGNEPGETPEGGDDPNQDPSTALVRDIVYGDPEEAGRRLRTTLESTAHVAARQAIEAEHQRNERRRNSLFVDSFKASHPDIDSEAEAVITQRLFALQREDLENLAPQLGIHPEQLPQDNATLANWHWFYRSRGLPVRSVEQMTEKAYGDFKSWEEKRGYKKTEPAPSEVTRETAPTKTTAPAQPQAGRSVDIVVDRRDRRLAIQPQPSKTSVPLETPGAAAATPSRSQVAQNMMRQRAALRGRVLQ